MCQKPQRSQESCAGKCNDKCEKHQNCCPDFKNICTINEVSNQELEDISISKGKSNTNSITQLHN